MAHAICSNPKCDNTYVVEEKTDDGFCCFECFEAVHCKAPPIVKFETLSLTD